MKEIPKEAKLRYIKSYLGEFFIKIDVPKIAKLSEGRLDDIYYENDMNTLRQIAAYTLLKNEAVNYKTLTSREVLDNFLTKNEDSLDLVSPKLLIIIHLKGTYPNKGLIDILKETISQRRYHKKKTIFLAEDRVAEIKAFFKVPTLKINNNNFTPKGNNQDVI